MLESSSSLTCLSFLSWPQTTGIQIAEPQERLFCVARDHSGSGNSQAHNFHLKGENLWLIIMLQLWLNTKEGPCIDESCSSVGLGVTLRGSEFPATLGLWEEIVYWLPLTGFMAPLNCHKITACAKSTQHWMQPCLFTPELTSVAQCFWEASYFQATETLCHSAQRIIIIFVNLLGVLYSESTRWVISILVSTPVTPGFRAVVLHWGLFLPKGTCGHACGRFWLSWLGAGEQVVLVASTG